MATATQEKREVTARCERCNWTTTAKKTELARKRYAEHMVEAHGAQQLPLEPTTNGAEAAVDDDPEASAIPAANPMPPLLPEIEAALRESIKRVRPVIL